MDDRRSVALLDKTDGNPVTTLTFPSELDEIGFYADFSLGFSYDDKKLYVMEIDSGRLVHRIDTPTGRLRDLKVIPEWHLAIAWNERNQPMRLPLHTLTTGSAPAWQWRDGNGLLRTSSGSSFFLLPPPSGTTAKHFLFPRGFHTDALRAFDYRYTPGDPNFDRPPDLNREVPDLKGVKQVQVLTLSKSVRVQEPFYTSWTCVEGLRRCT
ncbi:MAG: hypothetical protein AAF492_20350, partial [Verrucomicrobiota bacterium]